MNIYLKKSRTSLSYRILSAFIALTFIFSIITPPGYAQSTGVINHAPTVLNLPVPGTMVPMTAGFTPPLIKGITIHPENPLEFDFIVGTGDTDLKDAAFKEEARKLIKYFLASLTVPEDEMWVNLSPYEKDRIIPQGLGDTAMGRDLLAQDYILKQLTASLMYPEDELGKKFWNRVYTKAYEKFGTTEIPMNTFNKIWIVPEEAVVYERDTSAFVIKSRLKVMLEEDYVALQKNLGIKEGGVAHVDEENSKIISGVSSEVVREILIPEIEKEVNTGKNFAKLRQIYNSMILAAWYKKTLKTSLLGQVYVDQNKTKGVDTEDKQINQKIYDQYVESFKKGVYNYIREDYDPTTQSMIPRKYFSGGITMSSPVKGFALKGIVKVLAVLTITTLGALGSLGVNKKVTVVLADEGPNSQVTAADVKGMEEENAVTDDGISGTDGRSGDKILQSIKDLRRELQDKLDAVSLDDKLSWVQSLANLETADITALYDIIRDPTIILLVEDINAEINALFEVWGPEMMPDRDKLRKYVLSLIGDPGIADNFADELISSITIVEEVDSLIINGKKVTLKHKIAQWSVLVLLSGLLGYGVYGMIKARARLKKGTSSSIEGQPPKKSTSASPLSKEQITEIVKEITAKKFEIKEAESLSLKTSFVKNLGADSFATVELMTEFGFETQVTIPDEEMEKLKNIGDAVEYMFKNQSPAASPVTAQAYRDVKVMDFIRQLQTEKRDLNQMDTDALLRRGGANAKKLVEQRGPKVDNLSNVVLPALDNIHQLTAEVLLVIATEKRILDLDQYAKKLAGAIDGLGQADILNVYAGRIVKFLKNFLADEIHSPVQEAAKKAIKRITDGMSTAASPLTAKDFEDAKEILPAGFLEKTFIIEKNFLRAGQLRLLRLRKKYKPEGQKGVFVIKMKGVHSVLVNIERKKNFGKTEDLKRFPYEEVYRVLEEFIKENKDVQLLWEPQFIKSGYEGYGGHQAIPITGLGMNFKKGSNSNAALGILASRFINWFQAEYKKVTQAEAMKKSAVTALTVLEQNIEGLKKFLVLGEVNVPVTELDRLVREGLQNRKFVSFDELLTEDNLAENSYDALGFYDALDHSFVTHLSNHLERQLNPLKNIIVRMWKKDKDNIVTAFQKLVNSRAMKGYIPHAQREKELLKELSLAKKKDSKDSMERALAAAGKKVFDAIENKSNIAKVYLEYLDAMGSPDINRRNIRDVLNDIPLIEGSEEALARNGLVESIMLSASPVGMGTVFRSFEKAEELFNKATVDEAKATDAFQSLIGELKILFVGENERIANALKITEEKFSQANLSDKEKEDLREKIRYHGAMRKMLFGDRSEKIKLLQRKIRALLDTSSTGKIKKSLRGIHLQLEEVWQGIIPIITAPVTRTRALYVGDSLKIGSLMQQVSVDSVHDLPITLEIKKFSDEEVGKVLFPESSNVEIVFTSGKKLNISLDSSASNTKITVEAIAENALEAGKLITLVSDLAYGKRLIDKRVNTWRNLEDAISEHLKGKMEKGIDVPFFNAKKLREHIRENKEQFKLYSAVTMPLSNALSLKMTLYDSYFYLERMITTSEGKPISNFKAIGLEGNAFADFMNKAVKRSSSAINQPKMSTALQKRQPPGGINLNPELLDLQIKRDGNGVPLPIEMQPIGDMHIDGFIPIIISVTPVNLPMLLGLNEDGENSLPAPADNADTGSQAYPQAAFLEEKWFTREDCALTTIS